MSPQSEDGCIYLKISYIIESCLPLNCILALDHWPPSLWTDPSLNYLDSWNQKIPSFSTMAFFCSPPKTRKSNRNHYSVASHDLHNHSYPSRDQEYLQEISKTKQYQPSSRNYAFSANNAQTSTMTLQI